MKKLFSLLTFVALGFAALMAETIDSGVLSFNVLTAPSGSAYGTLSCVGLNSVGKSSSSVTVTVPYILRVKTGNYYVTTISQGAFQGSTNVRSVKLQYGVSEISSNAFNGCTSLTTVTIPSSVTTIGTGAFDGCTKLTTASLASLNPSGMSVGSSAFANVSAAASLCVPAGADISAYRKLFPYSWFPTLAHVGSVCDYTMANGARVVVSKAPTASENGEFTIVGFDVTASDAKNGVLTVSTNSTSVTGHDKKFDYVAVADSAFAGSTTLKQLNLSACTSIASIGVGAAFECASLTSVNIAAGTLQKSAFYGCDNLTSARLGACVVKEYAFSTCRSLSSVTLNAVTELGANAFRYSALTSITIPSTTTSIDKNFVDDVTSLKKIIVADGNTVYSSYQCALYDKALTTLIRVPQGYEGNTLYLPSSLTTIKSGAAYSCVKIKEVAVPYGVTEIGSAAFRDCSALTTVYIPSSVKKLGGNILQYCDNLTTLSVNTHYAPSVTSSNFKGMTRSSVNLHVQRGMVDAFKNAGWTGFASYNNNDVVATDYRTGKLGYTITSTAAESSHAGRARVVRHSTASDVTGAVEVPASITINGKAYAVTAIDTLAFGTANGFSLTGCANVDTIAYRAFYNQPVTAVKMPAVSHVGKEAFYGSNIVSAELPDKRISFGVDAFTNCSDLRRIVTSRYCTWDGKFFGNNASSFCYYARINNVAEVMESLNEYDYDDQYKCGERVAPCFKAEYTTFLLAAQANLTANNSNLPSLPRYITSYDAATGTARTSQGVSNIDASRGIILTDLTPGALYMIPRNYNKFSDDYTSILEANTRASSFNIGGRNEAYYWDHENLKFVRHRSGRYYIGSGSACLVVKDAGDEIYLDLFPKASTTGDVNGDGIVDITDVNMTINMVLGKVTKTTAGDIDGSGDVDITDVNAVINLMLGK